MVHTLVTVATIATSLCVFCDVHSHMTLPPTQPFPEDCGFFCDVYAKAEDGWIGGRMFCVQ